MAPMWQENVVLSIIVVRPQLPESLGSDKKNIELAIPESSES